MDAENNPLKRAPHTVEDLVGRVGPAVQPRAGLLSAGGVPGGQVLGAGQPGGQRLGRPEPGLLLPAGGELLRGGGVGPIGQRFTAFCSMHNACTIHAQRIHIGKSWDSLTAGSAGIYPDVKADAAVGGRGWTRRFIRSSGASKAAGARPGGIRRFRARRRAAGRQRDRRRGAGVDALLPRLRGADGALRGRRAGSRPFPGGVRQPDAVRRGAAGAGGAFRGARRAGAGGPGAVAADLSLQHRPERHHARERDAERGARGLEPVGARRLSRPRDAAGASRPGGGARADRRMHAAAVPAARRAPVPHAGGQVPLGQHQPGRSLP